VTKLHSLRLTPASRILRSPASGLAAVLAFSTLSASAWAQEADADAPGSTAAAEAPPSDGTAPAAEPSSDAAPSEGSSSEEAAPAADASSDSGASSGGSLFESAGSGEATSTDSESVQLDFGGYARGDVFVGLLSGTQSTPGINAAYGELSLQPKAKVGSWGSAVGDIRFRYGQQLDEMALFTDLREAYVNLYAGPVDLRLGKQIVVWGRADAFNPTNNISPVDFRIRSPVEDDRRIGNVGARGFLNLLPVRIEGVWMPLYQPTVLPNFPVPSYAHFTAPDYPTLSLRSGLLAGRVHLELEAIDASISYLHGEALLPGFRLAQLVLDDPGTGPDEPAAVYSTRTSYAHHVFGADFSTTVSDLFGVRGEAAFRIPDRYMSVPWTAGQDYWIAKPDIQWVLGLDREFGPVMVIAQYLGRYTFAWERAKSVTSGNLDDYTMSNAATIQPQVENYLFNQNRMIFNQLAQVQHIASARLEWKTLNDALSVSALGMFNFNTTEWMVMPKIQYQITGGLSATIGGEIYQGPTGTLLGVVDDILSAGYAEMRLTF
jgi:hypothetical protein